jgi:hypothetical protein
MKTRDAVGITVAVLIVMLGGTSLAQDRPTPGGRQDHSRRDELLARIPGAEKGQLGEVTDEAVARALPMYHFSALRFRQYPVARSVPPPLKPSNLVVEPPQGPAELITESKALEPVFRAATALAPVKDDSHARDAVKAWLRLAEELYQDGYFQFSVPADSVVIATEDGRRTARGKFVVTRGGKGEIGVILTFDAAGKLIPGGVDTSGRVLPGVRPICQATKLLDPDPIVRQMAERDILVMGRAVEGYLIEQRARATPELRRAIDRLWKRILDEGW